MAETSSLPLAGKVAFISGRSRGIGKATTMNLAENSQATPFSLTMDTQFQDE
jgi:NADP-dependent 3-hydroxy acid dehydrogenase YdfG